MSVTDTMPAGVSTRTQAAVVAAYEDLGKTFPNGDIHIAISDLIAEFMDMMTYTPYSAQDLQPQIELLHDLYLAFCKIERVKHQEAQRFRQSE